MARLKHATTPLTGAGLFSGKPSRVWFAPAAAGAGITFVCDGGRGGGASRVRATVANVTGDTAWTGLPRGAPVRNTSLASQGGAVAAAATVEHVLSALVGLSVWDAEVHMEGVEAPILDGSAAPFVEALRGMLVEDNDAWATRAVRLAGRVEVRDQNTGAKIVGEPLGAGEGASYTYQLDYGGLAPIRAHSATWEVTSGAGAYARDVAPARTFSTLAEVEVAQRVGMFRHLTARDMLVIGPDGLPVENAWRFPDGAGAGVASTEPARHKLLDLIGDLALLGGPLLARVTATRSGHALTHEFSRAVLAARA